MSEQDRSEAMTDLEIGIWLARFMASPALSAGLLAELRRSTASAIAPAFWSIVSAAERAANREIGARPEPWKIVVQAIAILTPKGDRRTAEDTTSRGSAHHSGASLGKALFLMGESDRTRPGYAESRLSRLLSARANQFDTLLLRACRSLAANDQPVNCGELARLILARDPQHPSFDQRRQQVARDYYRALTAAQSPTAL